MIENVFICWVIIVGLLCLLFILHGIGRLFVLYKNHRRPFWARRDWT